MVGGFIKQHHVGLTEQEGSEHDPGQLATAQRPQSTVRSDAAVGANLQAGPNFVLAGKCFPSPCGVEIVLDRSERLQPTREQIDLAEIEFGEFLVKLVESCAGLTQCTGSLAEHGVHREVPGGRLLVLPTHADPRRPDHLAFMWG